MKKSGKRWWLRNSHVLNGFVEHIQGLWLRGERPTVQFLEADRTSNQNSMIYALYGEIARQVEDKTVQDVRNECKLFYGVPIMRASDPEFRAMWDEALLGDKAPHEKELDLMTYMDITSKFTKKMASEYLDTIIIEYGKRGFALADPRMENE